jgi:DNA-binding MarR family transcriptional regulator
VIKKLVKRADSPFDKRETVISLTQSGIAILMATTEKINDLMETNIVMKSTDAATINELLEKLRGTE